MTVTLSVSSAVLEYFPKSVLRIYEDVKDNPEFKPTQYLYIKLHDVLPIPVKLQT